MIHEVHIYIHCTHKHTSTCAHNYTYVCVCIGHTSDDDRDNDDDNNDNDDGDDNGDGDSESDGDSNGDGDGNDGLYYLCIALADKLGSTVLGMQIKVKQCVALNIIQATAISACCPICIPGSIDTEPD